MRTFTELDDWLAEQLSCIELKQAVADLVRSGAVECVLWAFVGGGSKGDLPLIAPHVVHRAATLGIRIYIEHWYDDPVENAKDWPTKTWLPDKANSGHDPAPTSSATGH